MEMGGGEEEKRGRSTDLRSNSPFFFSIALLLFIFLNETLLLFTELKLIDCLHF